MTGILRDVGNANDDDGSDDVRKTGKKIAESYVIVVESKTSPEW